ncbi:MAG: histidinol-phosphate transaminase [Caulobacteraceae bacterium]|nr:histidinol-phosphate transaminase [Caulobacteraceae bacterium]
MFEAALPQSPQPKPGILQIAQYQPGKAKAAGFDNPVKLSANENILGCSPAARAAYLAAAGSLNLYPDPRGSLLRAAVASRYAVERERLILGNGTDEVFALLNQTYLQPGDNIVQGEFGFGAFAIGARANLGEVRFAPEPDLKIDVDEILAQVDERTRIVFIANPGNPTGTYVTSAEVRRLHAGLRDDILLVLDGAYAEFVEDPAFDDGLDLAREAGNVVVTHTFSKLHGLAGLRVGWAYAPLAVAEAVERIRLPFNTSIPAQRAAIAALADEDFQAASLDLVRQWRPWLAEQLTALGLEVTPSAANFLLFGFPENLPSPGAAEAFLASRGLIVRGVGNYGLPRHLRVTIGLEEHNRALVGALADFLQGS